MGCDWVWAGFGVDWVSVILVGFNLGYVGFDWVSLGFG